MLTVAFVQNQARAAMGISAEYVTQKEKKRLTELWESWSKRIGACIEEANAEKHPLFSAEERVEIIRDVFREYPNIEVDTFDGLLVEYARRRRASALIRGLRAVSDFEYEFQMALMNRHLEPTLETVFMMPAEQYTYLSSRLIKEVFSLGGEVRGLVPSTVEQWMRRKTKVQPV